MFSRARSDFSGERTAFQFLVNKSLIWCSYFLLTTVVCVWVLIAGMYFWPSPRMLMFCIAASALFIALGMWLFARQMLKLHFAKKRRDLFLEPGEALSSENSFDPSVVLANFRRIGARRMRRAMEAAEGLRGLFNRNQDKES